MNLKKPCLGVDIGDAYIKFALREGGEISRMAVFSLPEDVVENGEIVSAVTLLPLLKAFLKKQRFDAAKECAFILPDRQTFLRPLTLPRLDEKKLLSTLPFELKDFITAQKESYYFDYAFCGEAPAESGKEPGLELIGTAVKKDVLENYRLFFKKLGLKMLTAAPRECAFSNIIRAYLAAQPATEPGKYGILDLGHNATRLFIYNGSRFEITRVIESGCFLVDEAISRNLSIEAKEARLYKEHSLAATQLLEEAITVYNSIALEIKKAVNFYNYSSHGSPLDAIYCAGGGSHLEPLMQTIQGMVDIRLHSLGELMPVREDAKHVEICAAAAGITLQ